MGVLQLQLSVDGKTKPLMIPPGSTIKALMEQILNEGHLPASTTIEQFYVVCEGHNLEYAEGQTLDTYEIRNLSTLTVAVRVPGGAGVLKPLEGEVEVTTDACSITYDDDPEELRARMSCGHAIK